MDLSIDEHKFTGIEQDATGVGKAVLPRIGAQEVGFVWTRRPRQSQPVSPLNLLRQIRALPLQPRGEMFALAEDERVIER